MKLSQTFYRNLRNVCDLPQKSFRFVTRLSTPPFISLQFNFSSFVRKPRKTDRKFSDNRKKRFQEGGLNVAWNTGPHLFRGQRKGSPLPRNSPYPKIHPSPKYTLPQVEFLQCGTSAISGESGRTRCLHKMHILPQKPVYYAGINKHCFSRSQRISHPIIRIELDWMVLFAAKF